MRRALRRAIPVVVVVAVLVTACGVRPTGVIGAGDPAVAQQAVPQTTVYLVRYGRLAPVRRVAFPGAPQAALYDLWRRGATSQEVAGGMQNPLADYTLFDITAREGVLTVNYYWTGAVPRLVMAQIVCSGTAQPDVRRVRMVGWKFVGPGRDQPGHDFRHPPSGWTAIVGREKKCSQYSDLTAP